MDVLNIPNYAEAVLKERTIRDAAFIGITESVGPFEVVPITLRHWLILRLTSNPIVVDGLPSPKDVFNFLWLLSPKFTTSKTLSKRLFRWRCQRTFYPPMFLALLNTKRSRARFERKRTARLTAAAKIIDAAKAFVAESLQDRPPVPKTLGFEADYFSDGAYFCAVLAREYGWAQDEILNMPLKRVFQFINEMKHYHRSPVPLCNPSDRVKAKWLQSLQPRKNKPNGH